MSLEAVVQNLRNKTSGRVFLHVLLWLVYLSSIYYLDSISLNSYKGIAAVFEPIKSVVTVILVYYPLVYFVWPKFVRKRKYFLAILALALLVIFYTIVDHLLERAILESCEICMERLKATRHGVYELYQRGALNVVLAQLSSLGILYQLFLFLAFPLTIKVATEYFNQQVKTLKLEQQNIQLEFDFLKSQVNPHFLFNTLNNIYALILKDDKERSAETVARLASFMRYSLYESNTHSNNIVKEIDLLKVYIELERIRLNDTVVDFISSTDNENHTLPPLLFMPAVENAFKYCTRAKDGDASIFMKLEVRNADLLFMISNTFDGKQCEVTLHGGIGLQNLQKRLNHYYPGNTSSLEINETHKLFQLTIKLNLE